MLFEFKAVGTGGIVMYGIIETIALECVGADVSLMLSRNPLYANCELFINKLVLGSGVPHIIVETTPTVLFSMGSKRKELL